MGIKILYVMTDLQLETPKSQTAVLIVLIALEDSDTNSSLIAKALEVKEPRFAQPDAVQAALGAKPADGAFTCHP